MPGATLQAKPDGTRIPKQARARNTYENILRAAQEILDASGPEALNSNAIVERAGVTAPVFYRYFKNKHALLTVLGERLTDAQNALYVEAMKTPAANRPAVEAQVLKLITDTYKVTAAFTGALPLLVSLRAIPDLSSVRLNANREMAELTVPQLRRLRPGLSRREAYDRCRLAIEIGYSAIEMLLEVPDMARTRVLEQTAKAAVSAYFD